MTSRNPSAVTALLLLSLVAGCGGGGGDDAAPSSPPSTVAPVPGSYNADQLTQALLTDIPGYVRSGAPQCGENRTHTAEQKHKQKQQADNLDKPQCASSTRALGQEKAVQ